ncbi:hypothetical protein FA13DRAFT_1737030 [Coprinellus micaceus]|uniref:Uncharacterized protein n=1 Tax=Coprinellus micaceus TaxID=71717 RepID=A0A4Y7SYN2_COPMI|nr:hypothetical protein FA13DRAFT_1737030 [Coprinellus micaceus]
MPRNPLSEAKARRVLKGDQEQLENDVLQPIPEMIKDMLVFVVNLMAVHIPPTTDSLHDRIRPLGWEHIINVLSATLHCKDRGPLTSDTIKDARARLEEMYGTPKAKLRFMDLPVEPDPRGYAQRIAFPDGIPKHGYAFSTSTDAAEGVLAVPEPLTDLRRKRKGTRPFVSSFQTMSS